MSASASGSAAPANGSAKQRHAHHDGSADRAFTVDQKAAVIRIRRCSPTAFYEILGLEEVRATVSDADIKKAYRKLSLLTHPDKNGFEGADEAFKMVSRAFQILSDPEKKVRFDKFGGDPDNRFSGASASSSPFSGFARSAGRGGPMFEEEISPEEMFRQFFGGGMGGGFGGPFGGGLFDAGPGVFFNLGGGPGIRVHQFGGARPQRRPRAPNGTDPPPTLASTLSSLLPLILLFIIPLLSSLFSGSGGAARGPSISLAGPQPPHTFHRVSGSLKIPYWVDPAAVQDYGARKWRELDKAAEVRLLGQLDRECEAEQMQRDRLLSEAQGWFFVDEEKARLARGLEMRSCRRLGELGYRRA